MITLAAKERVKADNIYTLRKEGFIPAVFYGRKEASTTISLSEVDFMKVWKQAGESSIVVLKTANGDHEALIHDIDLDPVTDKVRHVDFYVVEKGKKVKVNVPLHFEGNSAAVKELGGTLVKVAHEIEIEATPSNLPHALVVSIDSLVNFESQILAKDIVLPAGVEMISDPEEVIALVAEAKEEVEEEAAPVDLSAIELSEKKGKKEEEAPADAAE